MPEIISNYETGLEIAIAVINDAPKDQQKAIAVSLLNNLCSPIDGQHCAITQAVRDAAKHCLNSGASIPAWMEYEPISMPSGLIPKCFAIPWYNSTLVGFRFG